MPRKAEQLPSIEVLEGQFNRPPKDVIAFFQGKGNRYGAKAWDWSDTIRHAHDRAFTVAKVAQADVLASIRGSLQQAINDGVPYEAWRQKLTPELQRLGWWGKQEIPDPRTGEVKTTQLGSPRRLQTIYETNMATAYSAGKFAQDMAVAEDMPFWTYHALHGGNRRPEHQALDGLTYRYDDPFWEIHNPPQGFGCKCTRMAGDEDDVKANGWTVRQSKPEDFHVHEFEVQGKRIPTVGFRPPGARDYLYPHPGFDYSPGDLSWRTKQLLVDRIDAEASAVMRDDLKHSLGHSLDSDFKIYVDGVTGSGVTRRETLAVARLEPDTVSAIAGRGTELSTALLLTTDVALAHAVRENKRSKGIAMPVEMLATLPKLLRTWERRWDSTEGGLLYFSPEFSQGGKKFRWKVVFNPVATLHGMQMQFTTATRVGTQALNQAEEIQ